MALGWGTAFQEITLVLFTTLAPVGVGACVIICILLVANRRMDPRERSRLEHLTIIPLVMAMVGLIASATHLGTPSNALYVLTGVGRSPMSNEVLAAIVFLALTGLHWLYSFALAPNRLLQRIWCCAQVLAGLVCIGTIALAYDEPTIITWSTVYVPLNIWLAALSGGPLVALLTLRAARVSRPGVRGARILTALSCAGLVADGVVLCLQQAQLTTLHNGVTVASQLAAPYPLMIAFFLTLGAASCLMVLLPLMKGRMPSVGRLTAASALFLVGLFVVRFGFYLMHMTAGISL